jgi:hypothetical protein
MKIKTVLSAVLFTGILATQCTKDTQNGTNGSNLSLKESLNTGAAKLNTAVNELALSRGYQLLTSGNISTNESFSVKNGSHQDSITLEKIAGIYEYQPITYSDWCFTCYSKLFVKTGTSDKFIVKLPAEKVFEPWRFREVIAEDTVLQNNFVITASDYHHYSNNEFFDYKLNADVAISDTAIGNIDIQSVRSSHSDYNYSSDYTFANGYSINLSLVSGDTSVSMVSFSNGTEILLKETVNRIKTSGSHFHEKQYILDIGDVEIRRTNVSDSIEVFVGGVLQTNAIVEIIDNNPDGENNMCRNHNRDIRITFDDGTSATLTDLLQPSMLTLENMVASLESVGFASNIVDYIAISVSRNQ